MVAVRMRDRHPTVWEIATVRRLERLTHADDRSGQPTEAVVTSQPFAAEVDNISLVGVDLRRVPFRCWAPADDIRLLPVPSDEEQEARWAWEVAC
jgi:hypothetical protein